MKTAIPSLKPKQYRSIQNLAGEWYKALYHTQFQLTKSAYLQHLYDTAVGYQRAKEPNPNDRDLFIKALNVLKYSVNAPTTAGLRDPSAILADAIAAQQQSKPSKGKTATDSYAAAVTGKSSAPVAPIGAKLSSAKAPAKSAGVAIGAPIVGQVKAKPAVDKPPIGSVLAARQDSTKTPDAGITPDSALNYLANAPSNQSFADFQSTGGSRCKIR